MAVATGDGDRERAVEVGATAASTSTTATEPAVEAPTTTSAAIVPALSPPATTRLPAKPRTPAPRPSATATTANATPASSSGYGLSPLEPGTQAWSQWGASRTVEQGRTRLVWGIYPRDLYGPDYLQTTAEIHDEAVVTWVHVDFGDGTSWEPHWGYYQCDPRLNAYPKPNPIHYQTPRHDYPVPGDYVVKVTIRTEVCDPFDDTKSTQTMSNPNVVSAALTVHVHAEKCRPGIKTETCPG